MNPKIGTFFAVHGDELIADGIQLSEKIQEKRINNWHGQKLWNHIGAVVEKDGIICAAEALQNGFTIHPWEDSRYAKNQVEFVMLELYRPWIEKELFAFNKSLLSIEGTPYDFEGIIDQADFVTTGAWKGETGIEAQARMYCSEAIATKINDLRKGIFIYPWLVNPQMFFENPNIVPCKEQLYIKPI